MNSLVYFYSKFTEEFLLLCAAGVFTLLSIYCYHWVIQKRRMGIARSQIPSAVVKSYLSQLINEAEFVRKQLFGMTDGPASYSGTPSLSSFTSPASEGNHQAISPDLMERVSSLETQLKDKESLVVNINIEKTKLLEEIEKLKAGGANASAAAGNQDQLSQKIKSLEARLEEYALFEEDLANLKRLQQENTQLKKKLDGLGAGSGDSTERAPLSVVPEMEAAPPPAAPAKEEPKHQLDSEAIETLLEGKPATPPETPAPKPVAAAVAPEAAPAAATPAAPAATPPDQFEKLVDSVETSLDIPPTPATTPEPLAAAASTPDSPLANKTDEELLKEFENLLNS